MNRKLCEGVYIPSKIREMDTTQFTLTALALAAIGIQFYSRNAITKEIGYDDGLLAVAGLFIITLLAMGYYGMFGRSLLAEADKQPDGHSNGFGRHFWDVDPYRVGAL